MNPKPPRWLALAGIVCLAACDGSTASAARDSSVDVAAITDAPDDTVAVDAVDVIDVVTRRDVVTPRDVIDVVTPDDVVDVVDVIDVPRVCPPVDAGTVSSHFVRLGPTFSGPWGYMGSTGLAAGNLACRQMGADHVCDFDELQAADARGELAAVPDGTTVWVNRLHCAMLDGVAYDVGASNCAGFTYASGDTYDGEYARVTGGHATFVFDEDPRPFHLSPRGLSCRSERYAPCCSAP